MGQTWACFDLFLPRGDSSGVTARIEYQCRSPRSFISFFCLTIDIPLFRKVFRHVSLCSTTDTHTETYTHTHTIKSSSERSDFNYLEGTPETDVPAFP